MNFQRVNGFDEIKINPETKTLIICDIDDTLIKSKKELNHFYQMIKSDFPDYTYEELQKEAWDMQQMYNQIYGYVHTDLDGFTKLLEQVTQSNEHSQFVFLTARSKPAENITKKHFASVGLDYENFQVHYTNNEKVKGQYILDHMDLTGFDHLIFIDDSDVQINSVLDLLGDKDYMVSCYKFEISGYKDIDINSNQNLDQVDEFCQIQIIQ